MSFRSVKAPEQHTRYMEASSLGRQVLLSGIGGEIYNATESYVKCPASPPLLLSLHYIFSFDYGRNFL